MTATLHIDDRPYPARPDCNLLEVCLSLGFDLPYFCWHPALGSVGACRQCAVKQFKDEHDRHGRLVMACMTPAAEGTRISIEDADARAFRAEVIELLMTNHPHDCPVCDEGGECHLQDMTVMTGHNYRRCRSPKRTFRNQDLGPFVSHEMNRCITCYRCVRFYRDYAGGRDLQALASRNRVYFGRERDGTLENPFSGNLVEVCPTGVFTDRPLGRHYTRKWDLQNAPSICIHCSAGCNTLVSERYGTVRRTLNRYHEDVNGHFLCDRGRFGYEFVNGHHRVSAPLLRAPSGELRQVTAEAALAALAELLRGDDGVIAIGSPRASVESNFALRELVGAERFFCGASDTDAELCELIIGAHTDARFAPATVPEIERSDAVLVVGEDVTATAPRIALAVRQSARNAAVEAARRVGVPHWDSAGVQAAGQRILSPVYTATLYRTQLEDIAAGAWHGPADELSRFIRAVAHALDSALPAPQQASEDLLQLAGRAADALARARRPLIVSGAGCRSVGLLQEAISAAAALRRAGRDVGLRLIAPECNSIGLALLRGRPLSEAFNRVRSGQARTVIVLENDLYRRAAPSGVRALLSRAQVIALDCVGHDTVHEATACLPAAAFAESSGTLVSSEGRAQRFFRALLPDPMVRDSWRWLGDLQGAVADSDSVPWPTLDHIVRACAASQPALRGIEDVAPPAWFREVGQRIPRQPLRYSGRTAMHAQRSVHEPKPPADEDSPLAFSMEGFPGAPPPALLTHYWAPGWNSYQAVHKFRSEIAAAAGASGEGAAAARDAPGVRLFAAGAGAAADASTGHDVPALPPKFEARLDAWWLMPRHLVFGSDELSVLAPAVAERAGRPSLLLCPGDARRLNAEAGSLVEVSADGASY